MGIRKKRLFIENIMMAARIARLMLRICYTRMILICMGIAGLCAIMSLSLAHDMQEVAVAMQTGDILLCIAEGAYRGFNPTWFLFMMLITSPAIFVGQIIGKPLEAKLLLAGEKRQTVWSGYCLTVVMLVTIALGILVLCACVCSMLTGGKLSLSAAAPGVSLWHSNYVGDLIEATKICIFLCVLLIGCTALGFLQLFISSIFSSFIAFLFQAVLLATTMLAHLTLPTSYLMASRCSLFDAAGLDIQEGIVITSIAVVSLWVVGSIFYKKRETGNIANNYKGVFARFHGARRINRLSSFALLLKYLLTTGRFHLILISLFGIGVALVQVVDLVELIADEPQLWPLSFGDLLLWSVWGSSKPEPLLGAIAAAKMPVIPFAWLMRVLFPLALVFISSFDMQKSHMVTACGSRTIYWFACCAHIVIQIGLYWLAVTLSILCCGILMHADSSIMSSIALADMVCTDGNAASFPLINSLTMLAQAVCISCALALAQELLTLFFDAKTVFLGFTILFCISVFVSSPFLPGEHMMAAREFARVAQQDLPFSFFVYVCLASVVCAACSIVWGANKIRTLDFI